MFNCMKKKADTSREMKDDYLVGTSSVPKDPNTDYRVWIPFAENIHETAGLKMTTRGEHRHGYPEGLVVHWTAGWALKRGFWMKAFPSYTPPEKKLRAMARDYALRTGKTGVKNRHNYLIMDVFGNIYQSRPLTKWGYHAGKSYWEGLGHGVSQYFAGIEILSPGRLEKKRDHYESWFGLTIPDRLVRIVPQPKSDNRTPGAYAAYTKEQEDSLIKLCLWLRANSPYKHGKHDKVFNVLNVVGHDEVSPGRKTDPGGSLSMSMQEFRRMLLKEQQSKGI